MKAAVYYEPGAPDVFRYEDVPDPECHAAGIVIEVKAISIEGGDVLNRAGGDMAGRPHIVGYQCAGIIREAGPSVTDRKVGQAVVAVMQHGSHAALVSVAVLSPWAFGAVGETGWCRLSVGAVSLADIEGALPRLRAGLELLK